jgi:Gas vesicle synthesis protein GvpL/GvpF
VSKGDLERWAAREAPKLIARAQADALELARERLTARLVDALLEAADARLRPEPLPAPRTGSALWLYGVVAAEEPPAIDGIDGYAVRVHRHAGLTALVSDVPLDRFNEDALKSRLEDLERLEPLARAHEAVLEAAMTQGAVVPIRLCTIYATPESLNAMLDREQPALTAALDRLDGTQEWGVKVFLATPAAVGAAAEPAPESGTDYLSRKRGQREAAEAHRDKTDAVVAGIHAQLAECAAAAVLSRPHDRRLSGRDAEMVLNGAYLVPTTGRDRFRGVVEQLRRQHDALDLELTGPWPPYHFTETPAP